jgi:hypothetical protein
VFVPKARWTVPTAFSSSRICPPILAPEFVPIPSSGEYARFSRRRRVSRATSSRLDPELSGLLDRFLAYGETTTSLINASPIPRRDPPLDGDERLVRTRR